MNSLEKRIQEEGEILPGNVLRVDSFSTIRWTSGSWRKSAASLSAALRISR